MMLRRRQPEYGAKRMRSEGSLVRGQKFFKSLCFCLLKSSGRVSIFFVACRTTEVASNANFLFDLICVRVKM